ncbi:MAG: ABC transporter permease [Saprospiraceae bacterium]|nr:ABC transporter permease [Saprospiraceae bacterium]
MKNQNTNPPRLASWLLIRFLGETQGEEFLGDLAEIYQDRYTNHGALHAKCMYWLDAVHLILGFTSFRRNRNRRPTLFKHHLLLSWRILQRDKAFSFINISGLTLGMLAALLIVFWIRDEWSYDRFHEKSDQIYSVFRHSTFTNEVFTGNSVPYPLVETLEKDYPEVEQMALIRQRPQAILQDNEIMGRASGFLANSDFFSLFSWQLLAGEASTLLDDPYSIVISASQAEKYYGPNWKNENAAVGQSILVDNNQEYLITGVFEDVPAHSSIQFDFVLSIKAYLSQAQGINSWDNSNFQLYVQLREDADLSRVNEKIKLVQNDHIDGFTSEVFLHPLTDLHLGASFEQGKKVLSGMSYYIRIFSLVVFFILLIAGINFINLTITKALDRAKEIGIRKAIGAGRMSILHQFISHSLLLVVISFVFAIILFYLALPLFNTLTGKNIIVDSIDSTTLLAFVGIGGLTVLIASLYPAIFLSSLQAVQVLKGSFRLSKRGLFARKSMVVFQFAISVLLIVGTLTVYKQLHYIQSKNLGLDRENVIYTFLNPTLREKLPALKEELLRQAGIQSVSSSSQSPLEVTSGTHSYSWPGLAEEGRKEIHTLSIDYDFLEVMDMQLQQGRTFDTAFGADSITYLINEEFQQYMGIENPIGEKVTLYGRDVGTIIGVVEDFHMSSLYNEIEPLIMLLRPNNTFRLFLRTEAGKTKEAIAGLEAVYKAFSPDVPFTYLFLDEQYQATYENELVVGRLSIALTALAVLIACLGLLGLATFAAHQRLKEISIRKTLGADVGSLLFLLSKDFMVLVLLALIIALPLSYLLMGQWLNSFAYHIAIGSGIFLTAAGGLIGITLLTISWETLKVAIVNPAKILRSE